MVKRGNTQTRSVCLHTLFSISCSTRECQFRNEAVLACIKQQRKERAWREEKH